MGKCFNGDDCARELLGSSLSNEAATKLQSTRLLHCAAGTLQSISGTGHCCRGGRAALGENGVSRLVGIFGVNAVK